MSTELIAAVRKLVKAKGRYHTEQNYLAMVAALDMHDAEAEILGRASPAAAVPEGALPPLPEPSAANIAAELREIIVSAKANHQWLIADRARNALHMLAAVEADRAQQGEPVYYGVDWVEDSAHENGNYENRCSGCGISFIGHKRRVVCKSCATKAAAPADAPKPIPDRIQKKWLHDIAQDAGFAVNLSGELVVPAPYHDAEPYLRRLLKLVAAPAPDTGIPTAGEVPNLEQIELTYAIAGKIAEFYPQEAPRDMEKNHRLARAIQRLPDLREVVASFISRRAPVSSTPTSGAVEKEGLPLDVSRITGVVQQERRQHEVVVKFGRSKTAAERFLHEFGAIVLAEHRAAPSHPSEAKAGETKQ